MNLKDSILDIHGEIEDELNFIIDVDNSFVNECYNILDNIDSKYLTIENIEEEKLVTLYKAESEGLTYLNELKELLFLIKKKGLKLNLKKLKLLLRRKRKQKEIIFLLKLLKEKELFFNNFLEYFSKKEQQEIKEYIETIKTVTPQKEDIKKEKKSIKDNIKLTSMIGITSIVGAAKVIIPTSMNEKIKYKIEKTKEEQKAEEIKKKIGNKLNTEIRITTITDTLTLKKALEVTIPNKTKENIKNISDKLKEKKETIEEIEQLDNENAKEDNNILKNTAKAAGIISVGAATVVVAPTIAKATIAVAALKTLSESNEKEDSFNEERCKEENNEKDTKEILDFVEEIEEEDVEKKAEEILADNGLTEEKKNKDALTKEERFKVFKIEFENINKEHKKETLRLRNIEEEKTKKERKNQKSKPKTPISKLMSRVGRTAFMLSINMVLANLMVNQLGKGLAFQGKTKILK